MTRSGRSGSRSGRIVAIVLAVVALAVVAEAGVLLLAPEEVVPAPVSVDEADYFDPAQVENATDYRSGQRDIFLVGLAIELLALGSLALGRPRWARRLLDRLSERPILGAALAGIGISLLLALLALPTGLIAHERAVDVGLSTQELPGWFADRARSAAIAALLAGLGAMMLVAVQRRFPRRWWVPGSAIVIGYAIVSTWLAPVLLAPIFNDFEAVPEGPVRQQVLELADRSGVDVGEVYVVDASRRSTALNAYVDGIGSTKRVVLYDNLLDRTEGPALRSVVAHELGHIANHDLPRGLLFVAIVTPLGMLLVALAGAAISARGGAVPGTPAALPSFALMIVVVTLAVNLAGNQLSRRVEASADRFSLELTDDPRGLVGLQRRLAGSNLSDPDPSNPVDLILRTHPTTAQRIGSALAYGEERGIDLGEPPFGDPR